MKWDLEKRTCACGCGSTFKVLPTSKQIYAAKYHNPYVVKPGYVKLVGPITVEAKLPVYLRKSLF